MEPGGLRTPFSNQECSLTSWINSGFYLKKQYLWARYHPNKFLFKWPICHISSQRNQCFSYNVIHLNQVFCLFIFHILPNTVKKKGVHSMLFQYLRIYCRIIFSHFSHYGIVHIFHDYKFSTSLFFLVIKAILL